MLVILHLRAAVEDVSVLEVADLAPAKLQYVLYPPVLAPYLLVTRGTKNFAEGPRDIETPPPMKGKYRWMN